MMLALIVAEIIAFFPPGITTDWVELLADGVGNGRACITPGFLRKV